MRPFVTRRRSAATVEPPSGRVEQIGVVIPARNEAASIAACLVNLAAAAAAVAVGVTATLVADSCSDDTVVVASATAERLGLDLRVARIGVGSVGRARATGMDVLLDLLGAPGTWLATTDADSAVPPHWLARQLAYATEGTALVAGTVSVSDWSAWPTPVRLRAEADYRRPGSRHVHGANLGFRAEAYRRVGGFAHRASDEDRALVDSFLAHGEPVVWAEDLAVCTSARRVARAPHGFASYLAALGAGGGDTVTLETGRVPDLEASPDAPGIHPWVVAWVAERAGDVPVPGAGRTWTRLATLADVAGHDLSAARLVEGHLDALAILAELGHPPTGSGLYGVWAAHRPGELVAVPTTDGWSLTGTKPFCSGAGLLSRALVVADSPEGPRLFDLDVAGVDVGDGTWPAVGMAGSQSLQVRWSGERIRTGQAVGGAGAYTQRIGFWWGAVGVAACWWGGARELLRVVAEQLRTGTASEVQLADLGAAWACATAAESSLRAAAEVIDHGDDVEVARRGALLTRQIVHDAAVDIVALTSSAGGARPLCLDPAQSRRAADLPAYLAQHHRGRDNVALGRLLTDRG